MNNGIDNNFVSDSGAAYIFTRSGGVWSQEAFLKASNTRNFGDGFGTSVAISGDGICVCLFVSSFINKYQGNMVAIGAPQEHGIDNGINGNDQNFGTRQRGAVYVFEKNGTWSQTNYGKNEKDGSLIFCNSLFVVKASYVPDLLEQTHNFGFSVSFSRDGSNLLIGSTYETTNGRIVVRVRFM